MRSIREFSKTDARTGDDAAGRCVGPSAAKLFRRRGGFPGSPILCACFIVQPMNGMRLLAIALPLALAACGLFPSAAERAVQRSPNFKAGYNDGCAAASTAGANYREDAFRDEALYKTSAAYRAGWGNGYSICRREGTGAMPGSPLDNSVLNPSPGAH